MQSCRWWTPRHSTLTRVEKKWIKVSLAILLDRFSFSVIPDHDQESKKKKKNDKNAICLHLKIHYNKSIKGKSLSVPCWSINLIVFHFIRDVSCVFDYVKKCATKHLNYITLHLLCSNDFMIDLENEHKKKKKKMKFLLQSILVLCNPMREKRTTKRTCALSTEKWMRKTMSKQEKKE